MTLSTFWRKTKPQAAILFKRHLRSRTRQGYDLVIRLTGRPANVCRLAPHSRSFGNNILTKPIRSSRSITVVLSHMWSCTSSSMHPKLLQCALRFCWNTSIEASIEGSIAASIAAYQCLSVSHTMPTAKALFVDSQMVISPMPTVSPKNARKWARRKRPAPSDAQRRPQAMPARVRRSGWPWEGAKWASRSRLAGSALW